MNIIKLKLNTQVNHIIHLAHHILINTDNLSLQKSQLVITNTNITSYFFIPLDLGTTLLSET